MSLDRVSPTGEASGINDALWLQTTRVVHDDKLTATTAAKVDQTLGDNGIRKEKGR